MSQEPAADSSPRNDKNGVKSMKVLLPMNGGDDSFSYYKNSYYQRIAANFEHQKINEEIAANFDVENLLSLSSTIRIVDFGCATGPNTIINMQTLIDTVKLKYQTQCPMSKTIRPEFQVFFNDLVANDFNTLFKSLPTKRDYFAAAVPGSFHHQLFPESSLHLAYTSHSLHWLSKLPVQLGHETSPAWNKGRVHYTNAPEEVVRAYKSQFGEEMGMFLQARAKELVVGGMVVMIMSGASSDLPFSSTANGTMFEFMGSSLMEMVKEGLIKESQVDSFNLPLYSSASPQEITKLVEKNGCFSIERIELSQPSSWLKSPVDIPEWMMHVRAAMEGNFIKHFGSHEIVDELFTRLTRKHLDRSEMLPEWCNQKVQMFVVLKRDNTF